MQHMTDAYDSVKIESHTLCLAMWGELIARNIGCENDVFLLAETFPKYTRTELDFLRFKLKTGKLAFIDDRVGCCLLGESAAGHSIKASLGSPLVDNASFSLKMPSVDISIVCLSRLEKSFIAKMLLGLSKYCIKHNDRRFLICFIGGYTRRIKFNLNRIIAKADNLQVIYLGSMPEIGIDLVKEFDLAISKAGSARVCAACGIPTIRYSINRDEPMDILSGEEIIYPSSADGSSKTLDSFLDYLLFPSIKNKAQFASKPSGLHLISHPDYRRHFEYFDSNKQNMGFFDVKSIVPCKERLTVSLLSLPFCLLLRNRSNE